MANQTAVVVSDDPCLTESIGQSIERQCGSGARSLPLSTTTEILLSGALPSWLFLDLRDSSRAEELLTVWGDWNKFQRSAVSLIGVSDLGYSPRLAGLADRVLSGSMGSTVCSSAIEELLDAATSATRQRNHQDDDYRILEGTEHQLVTYSEAMFPVIEQLRIAALHDLTVVLEGETGTGKTTVARLIHELSSRRQNRFLTVACGGLPNELIDSELFGHVKGAFTGADRTKVGKFESAEGGTILLDEIDCLGMNHQAKLLRVLETGEFELLGSNETRMAKARIVVASNVRLDELVNTGQFRADLYYRLTQLKLALPPLRERVPDIVPLAMRFLEESPIHAGHHLHAVDINLIRAIKSYTWPGNIRELKNEMRRASLVSQFGRLGIEDLAPDIVRQARGRERQPSPGQFGLASDVAQTERDVIEQMLQTQNFNRAATARALGISRVTLYNKIRKHQIHLNTVDGRRSRNPDE